MAIAPVPATPTQSPQVDLFWRVAVAALDAVVLLYGCILMAVWFGGFSLALRDRRCG